MWLFLLTWCELVRHRDIEFASRRSSVGLGFQAGAMVFTTAEEVDLDIRLVNDRMHRLLCRRPRCSSAV